MSLLDLIGELRKGTPDVKKAEKAMRILGWLCLIGGVWNFILHYIFQNIETIAKRPTVLLPLEYLYVALVSLAILGWLFFHAARGIGQLEPWGKKTGQSAIALLFGLTAGFMFYFMFSVSTGISTGFSLTSGIVCIIFAAQFGLPAYFGIRYLGRLPVRNGSHVTYQHRTESKAGIDQAELVRTAHHVTYSDSPTRLGVYGTFALLIAVPMLIGFIASEYFGKEIMALIVFVIFFIVLTVPVAYNYFASPFQRGKTLLASFTGGGSIFLFGGSWPFFRLLVYKDAIEVRAMFQRYLIPYDKMDDLPEKIGFFTSGILIKSDLPGVPSRIRYQGFGMKKTLEVVNNARKKFMGETPSH